MSQLAGMPLHTAIHMVEAAANRADEIGVAMNIAVVGARRQVGG